MGFCIAVIGCGAMANNGHGPACRKYADQHADVELAACCDIIPAQAERFRQAFGFSRSYTDFRHMLAEVKPDAVCLFVPPEVTASLAAEVMQLGYPLLLEKPPALTAADCRRLAEIAARAGVINMVAFNRRYTPLVRKARELVTAQHQPEDIFNLRCDFQRIGRHDADFSTTAIHGIDTVRYLAGADFTSIRFRYQELPQIGPGVANIHMDCLLSSGATAQLSFLPVTGFAVERVTVNAADHTYVLHVPIARGYDYPGRLIHLHRGRVVTDIAGDSGQQGAGMFELCGFYGENEAFFTAVRAGIQPADNIRSAVQSVTVAEAIRLRQEVFTA